jgi:hypothetical protein
MGGGFILGGRIGEAAGWRRRGGGLSVDADPDSAEKVPNPQMLWTAE